MTPHFWPKNDKNDRGEYFQKNWVGMCGTLPETLTLFQTKICDFPYPISDLIKNLIPYFRPEALEPGAWPERVTSCYGTYTVVGVNIKREMVLSPNDEEVANSSKKHTQFKTRVNKPYPISDQNGWKKHTPWRRTYPYSLYKGLPPRGEKSVADYESPSLRKQDKTINDLGGCFPPRPITFSLICINTTRAPQSGV